MQERTARDDGEHQDRIAQIPDMECRERQPPGVVRIGIGGYEIDDAVVQVGDCKVGG